MDRDVAITINSTIGVINTALQKIVNGITNTPPSNRTVSLANVKEISELELEHPEAIPESQEEPTETTTRKNQPVNKEVQNHGC